MSDVTREIQENTELMVSDSEQREKTEAEEVGAFDLRIQTLTRLREREELARKEQEEMCLRLAIEQKLADELSQKLADDMYMSRQLKKRNEEAEQQIKDQVYLMHGVSGDKIAGMKNTSHGVYVGAAFTVFLLTMGLAVLSGVNHGFRSEISMFLAFCGALEGAILGVEARRQGAVIYLFRVLFFLIFPIGLAAFLAVELGYTDYLIYLEYVMMGGIALSSLSSLGYFLVNPYRGVRRKMRDADSDLKRICKEADKQVKVNRKTADKKEKADAKARAAELRKQEKEQEKLEKQRLKLEQKEEKEQRRKERSEKRDEQKEEITQKVKEAGGEAAGRIGSLGKKAKEAGEGAAEQIGVIGKKAKGTLERKRKTGKTALLEAEDIAAANETAEETTGVKEEIAALTEETAPIKKEESGTGEETLVEEKETAVIEKEAETTGKAAQQSEETGDADEDDWEESTEGEIVDFRVGNL